MDASLLPGLEISTDAESTKTFKSQLGGTGTFVEVSSVVFIRRIRDRVAVRINNPFEHRHRIVYHLLHWVPTNEFFVSTCQMLSGPGEPPKAVLREIVGHRNFLAYRGAIKTKHFIRAGKRAWPDDPNYNAWRRDFLMFHDPAFYRDMRVRKLGVFIAYIDEAGAEQRVWLGKPAVPDAFLLAEGAHRAMEHPRFWPWFDQAIQDKASDLESKIDRAIGVFLDVLDETPIQLHPPEAVEA